MSQVKLECSSWLYYRVKCTISIGGRTITNLRFAGDIDSLAGEEEELAILVERLDKASTSYGMEMSAEKTKVMTTPVSTTQRSK